MKPNQPVLAIILGLAGGRAWTDLSASSPATAPSPGASAGGGASTQSLAAPLRSKDANERQAALARLAATNDAFSQAMLDHSQDKDPEVSSRSAGALEQMRINTAVARQLLMISKPMREKFVAFRAAHPDLVLQAFSKDAVQQGLAIGAFSGIAGLEAAQRAEPLVAVLIASPYPEVADAAAELAKSGAYRSDEVVDSLLQVVLNPPLLFVAAPWGAAAPAKTPYPPRPALEALAAIRSPRAAPTLLAMMQRQSFFMMDIDLLVPDALVACGEPRAIPTLLKFLDSKKVLYIDGGGKESLALGDIALHVLVRLTGGNVEDYGFISLPSHKDQLPAMGFHDEPARKEALAKFRAWWEANKDKPPYKDLKPLSLPTLPAQR